MEVKNISVYGIPSLSREEVILMQHKLFMYLEALIRAERLNPESDYEGTREVGLLKKIATSDTTVEQRTTLMLLLEGREPNEEEIIEDDEQDED